MGIWSWGLIQGIGLGFRGFGYRHPVNDFTGPPSVVLGVPLTVVHINPSDDLHPFLVSNQHDLALLGHLVLGSYPGHGQAFLA